MPTRVSPIFENPSFSSNLLTKTYLNVISSLEKILETVFALIEGLKSDFSKIGFLPIFRGFSTKTQKIAISEFYKIFRAPKIAGNDFSPIFSYRKVIRQCFGA